MQATTAATLGLGAGDTFPVTYFDDVPGPVSNGDQEREAAQAGRGPTRLVGTYVVDDPGSPAWFDLSRFTGLDDLVVPPQRGTGSAAVGACAARWRRRRWSRRRSGSGSTGRSTRPPSTWTR